jgi:Mor family transcriptional regulator
VYISKYKEIDLDERNAAIYSDFNGRNQRELSLKYELNCSHIYKIIKQQRELHHGDKS